MPKSVTSSNPAGTYRVEYKASKGKLTGTRVFVQNKVIVTPDEYQSYKKFYNEALKEDNRQLLLKRMKYPHH